MAWTSARRRCTYMGRGCFDGVHVFSSVQLYGALGICSGGSMVYCHFTLSSFVPKDTSPYASSTEESEESDREEVPLLPQPRK